MQPSRTNAEDQDRPLAEAQGEQPPSNDPVHTSVAGDTRAGNTHPTHVQENTPTALHGRCQTPTPTETIATNQLNHHVPVVATDPITGGAYFGERNRTNPYEWLSPFPWRFLQDRPIPPQHRKCKLCTVQCPSAADMRRHLLAAHGGARAATIRSDVIHAVN